MAAGRTTTCPCGSGRKPKRCCGPPAPPDLDVARRHLAGLVVPAICMLVSCSKEELAELYEQALDLPALDPSLGIELPDPVPHQVDRLLRAVSNDDVEAVCAALPGALARVDGPVVRSELARVVTALRDDGRIPPRVAAVALLELSTPRLRRLMESFLVRAAVAAAGEEGQAGRLAG